MEETGLWQDILGARNIVAHHAQSLIYNVNNNSVEGYNSVLAKCIGGKRINFSLRGNLQGFIYLTSNVTTKYVIN